MKKGVYVVLALLIAPCAWAGYFLGLGDDYGFYSASPDFGMVSAARSSFNFDAGYMFDSGLNFSFRYDHLGIEDVDFGGVNVRMVCPVPSLGIGYGLKFMEDTKLFWFSINPGYGMSRVRLGVNDYRSSSFSLSTQAALYHRVVGQFYAGIELGYRYLNVKYTEPSEATLDLSGIFAGVSLRHVFGE